MHDRAALLAVSAAVVIGPWLLWRLPAVRRVAPLAVVQILAGIALGPSALGALAPGWHAALFTPGVLAPLGGVSAVGVLLFVLAAGMHLDAGALRGAARRLGPVALGSVALPLLLGLGVGAWVAAAMPGAVGPRGGDWGFRFAVAICVAVTALPVLAAILREMDLLGTRLGQSALALAALNDAVLWLMLALLLLFATGDGALGAARTLLLLALWAGAMLWLVRPALRRIARGGGEGAMLVAAVAAGLGSAAATEAIGLGDILGAFAAGALVPREARPALLGRIEPLVAAALLPFFFVLTGLRTRIDLGSGEFLLVVALATAATVAGKVIGTALPARAAGEPWPDALALGALMQTKGLMEVVVLSVLLDAGIIGPPLFSALVAMAVVCTACTAPAVRFALGRSLKHGDAVRGARAAP